MVWTPETIKAEVQRRHEGAQHNALIKQLRESGGASPSWWRKLRSHPEPVGSRNDGLRRSA